MFPFSMNGRGCQAENRISHRYHKPIASPVTFGKNKAPMSHQGTRVTCPADNHPLKENIYPHAEKTG
jgi:hypothetical protein